jgi:hypothetical protein
MRIVYDGREYAPVPGRSAGEVREEIAEAVGEGRSIWLAVVHGERRGVPTTLLVGPGTPIAVLDAVQDDLAADVAGADGGPLLNG